MKKVFCTKKILITSAVLLLNFNSCFASENTFNNNVLKLDVAKSASGGVKLTIYTKKPYNDAITVNKKSDTEYVILMPETANSITSKPSLSTASDVVNNIDIKTQQYQGPNQKGYTKIVVSTKNPSEVIAHTQTVKNSDYLLSETDYKELLSQNAKKVSDKIAQIKQEAKPETKKEVKKESSQPKASSQTSKVVKKEVEKTKTKKIETKQSASKKEEKESKKSSLTKPETSVKTEDSKTSESQTDLQIPQPVQSETQVQPPQEAQTEPQEEVLAVNSEQSDANLNISAEDVKKNKIEKYKSLIKDNIYYILALFFLPILLLSLIKRKTKKGQANQGQESLLKDALQESDEQIAPDWKEKLSKKSEQTQAPQEENTEELDNLFHQDFETDINEQIDYQEDSSIIEEEKPLEIEEIDEGEEDSETLSQYEEFMGFQDSEKEYSIDEIFGTEEEIEENKDLDETFLSESDVLPQEEKEKDELIKSAFNINSESGFYLVDYNSKTSLIGFIQEEIFVLKTFDYKITSPLQARLNEDKGKDKVYMLRVQNYKALVNVSQSDMKILIEL